MQESLQSSTKNQGNRFWKAFDLTLEVVSSILLFATLFLMLLQVFMRYVVSRPLSWSEELAKYSMVWMAMLGSVIAIKRKAHLCVDMIVGYFPENIRKAVDYATKILSLIFFAVMVYYGVKYVQINLRNHSLVTGINMGFVYSVIPISGLLMFIYTIRYFKEQ